MSATQQPHTSNAADIEQYPMIERKSIEHLKTYSVIKTTIDWIYYIPFTKQAKEVMTPTIKIIRNTQPLKVAYDAGDFYLDSILTRLDNCLERLQSAEVTNTISYISRPVKGTIDSIDKTVRSTDEKIMKQVVEPTMKTMTAVVGSISRPLTRGSSNNTTSVIATSKTNEKGKPAIEQTIEVITTTSAQQERRSVKESVSAVISSLSAK